jgi:hypothetical protein
MYCRVLNWMSTDVSEVRAASIIRAISTNSWNVGQYSVKNTAVHPRRFWASCSPPWELEISTCWNMFLCECRSGGRRYHTCLASVALNSNFVIQYLRSKRFLYLAFQ